MIDEPVNGQPLVVEAAQQAELNYQELLELASERHEQTRRAILTALYPDGDGNLVRHARRELEAAGLFASFDVLSPITSHPSEWMEVATGVFQNRRKSSVFWRAGEPSWYDLEERSES